MCIRDRSVAIQHLSSVPLSPREIDPEIPEALELICMKAMNADLTKRYQSADAMLVDLEKFRKDPTVDMDYIRTELATDVDSQPTSPIPVQKVGDAVRKRQADEEYDDDDDGISLMDYVRGNKKTVALLAGGVAVIVLIFVLIFTGFGGGGKEKAYKAVSYTHLDVYKRQERSCAISASAPSGWRRSCVSYFRIPLSCGWTRTRSVRDMKRCCGNLTKGRSLFLSLIHI